MKCSLFLLVFSILSFYAGAQTMEEEDSILTAYVNDLAVHSNLPYDSIRKLEMDSASRFAYVRVKEFFTSGRAAKGGLTVSGDGYPFDSLSVVFVLKERMTANNRRNKLQK
jgi:hypothetical protein